MVLHIRDLHWPWQDRFGPTLKGVKLTECELLVGISCKKSRSMLTQHNLSYFTLVPLVSLVSFFAFSSLLYIVIV